MLPERIVRSSEGDAPRGFPWGVSTMAADGSKPALRPWCLPLKHLIHRQNPDRRRLHLDRLDRLVGLGDFGLRRGVVGLRTGIVLLQRVLELLGLGGDEDGLVVVRLEVLLD